MHRWPNSWSTSTTRRTFLPFTKLFKKNTAAWWTKTPALHCRYPTIQWIRARSRAFKVIHLNLNKNQKFNFEVNINHEMRQFFWTIHTFHSQHTKNLEYLICRRNFKTEKNWNWNLNMEMHANDIYFFAPIVKQPGKTYTMKIYLNA